MIWSELSETLIALIESFEAPPDSGLVVTEVALDVPLEVQSGVRDGELIFFGSMPHTRWTSGVLPLMHLGQLTIGLLSPEDARVVAEGDSDRR